MAFLPGAILLLAGIAAYWNSFSVPFLFDDPVSIADNESIRHLWPPWRALLPPADLTVTGRPVANLTLAINHAVSGSNPWSYHALNLLIHLFAAFTLFGIVRRTLGSVGRVISNPPLSVSNPSDRRVKDNAPAPPDTTLLALAIALLWTLHPLQTEAVTYVVQRVESLMGLFFLLTLYCFIRSVDAPRPRFWQGGAIGACLLGMATKEVMALAPVLVLLYDRTFIAGGFAAAWRQRWRLHLALAANWLVLAGLVAGTGWNRNGTSGFDIGIHPPAYWLTQFEAVTRYLWLSVWPHPLVFEYGTFWVHRVPAVLPDAALVLALAGATLVALWRWPAAGFLGAWFFGILAPTSIMPGRFQMIVEHRMYLPLAALVACLAVGVAAGFGRKGVVALFALAGGLGWLTASRNHDYRSSLAIWSDTVAKRPDNPRAHCYLGLALGQDGRTAEAISHYERALQLQPDYVEAHNNLGVALEGIPGRLPEAVDHLEMAVKLNSRPAQMHANLGAALAGIPGRLPEAIAQLEEAVRLDPGSAAAHNNLGAALSRLPERVPEAIAQLEAAIYLKPDFAEAHNNLGDALVAIPGRLAEAVAEYEATLRFGPDSAEVRNQLGKALLGLPERAPEAVAQFEAAVRLDPGSFEAHYALGVLLSGQPGRRDEALAHLEAALRINPGFAPAREWLERLQTARP